MTYRSPTHDRPEIARERKPLWKSMQVIRWMVDNEGETWGVREIARGLGLAPSTVHRVLAALEEQGMVQSDPEAGGQYGLGLEFFRLAWKSTSRLAIRNVAAPVLEHLVKQTDETAFLTLFDRNRAQVIFVASVECSQELRYVVRLNEWMPPYLGASGLAIVAFLPSDEIDALLKELAEQGRRTPSLPTVDEISGYIETIRVRGYACTSGHRVPGAIGIAAPIFGSGDVVIADVGLSIPERRFSASYESALADVVVQAATTISGRLGGDWTRGFEAATRGERPTNSRAVLG